MDTNANEIQRAIAELDIAREQVRRLPTEEAANVYHAALRHFVPSGQPRWWWEHFPTSTAIHFPNGEALSHLADLVPDPEEKVWLIAEDVVSPEYSVWEANTRAIQTILGECCHFEYYLVQQQFRWLLCENHHDVVVAVGEDVETQLRRLQSNK